MTPTSDRPDEDFAAALAAFEAEQGTAPAGPRVGDRVRGEIVGLGEDSAFVDLGGKSEGMVALEELRDDDGELIAGLGDEVEGVVAGTDRETGCLVVRVRPGRSGAGDEAARAELEQAYEHRIPVEGQVTGVNRGGVEVEVAGVKAFCPVSQLDLGYVEDPSEYVGRRLTFRITRLGERRGRPDVVLSRRELLAEEAAARAAEARARLAVGKTVRGTVSSLAAYGAFVDLGGIEGLLHVSEISHRRVADPADVLAVGQQLDVEIKAIEPPRKPGGGERISLSLRALEADPWRAAAQSFAAGTVVGGRVVRLEQFGAFVELAPGVDGLLHVSELGGDRRVDHPRQVLEVGQELPVRVASFDLAKRRISLESVDAADHAAEPGEVAAAGGEPGAAAGGAGLGSLGEALKAALDKKPRR